MNSSPPEPPSDYCQPCVPTQGVSSSLSLTLFPVTRMASPVLGLECPLTRTRTLQVQLGAQPDAPPFALRSEQSTYVLAF